MSTSLSAQSRKKWRAKGYYVETAESFAMLPGGLPRKNDLFGFVDLIAVPLPESRATSPDTEWVYLQVTSRSNMSARLRKIQSGVTGRGQWTEPMRALAQAILVRGDRLIVEGWDKKDGRYRAKEREVTMEDLS